MPNPTAEEVIQYRQAHCQHAFVKGIADTMPQCVHCGLKEHEYKDLYAKFYQMFFLRGP